MGKPETIAEAIKCLHPVVAQRGFPAGPGQVNKDSPYCFGIGVNPRRTVAGFLDGNLNSPDGNRQKLTERAGVPVLKDRFSSWSRYDRLPSPGIGTETVGRREIYIVPGRC